MNDLIFEIVLRFDDWNCVQIIEFQIGLFKHCGGVISGFD
jgi:hypothetical protein